MIRTLIYIFIFQFLILDVFSQDLSYEKFTDLRDNKVYKTIKINDHTWFAENLAFDCDSGCWAYKNKNEYINNYGYLYNWKTAQNICPEGWHIPSKKDFEVLLKNCGGGYTDKAYNFLMSADSSFISTYLGGWRFDTDYFHYLDKTSFIWTSTIYDCAHTSSDCGWVLTVNTIDKKIGLSYFDVEIGISVRCIKNED